MVKVAIVFDSMSGNTEKMANAVADGVRTVDGVEVELCKLGSPFSIGLLNQSDAIVLGCPTEYGTVTSGMKRFVESMAELNAAKKLTLKGKVAGIFGSYAWDGGWAVDLLALRMKRMGLLIVPPTVSAIDRMGGMGSNIDAVSLDECRKLGKSVAEKIAKTSRRKTR